MGERQRAKQGGVARPKRLDAAKRLEPAKPSAARAKPLNRGRQVVRQWQILVALRGARFGLTMKQLRDAVDSKCTERTLYRDIEHLRAAGFGVDNAGERVVLRDDIGSLPFQPDDVAALSVVVRALQHSGAVGERLESLRDRLRSSLTPQGRAFCEELAATQMFTLSASLPAPIEQLGVIEDAIGREHLLRISYTSPRTGSSERVVRPYATWNASGQTYLVADCLTAKKYRTFHVARVQSAELLDEAFERDVGFSLQAYREGAFHVMSGEPERVTLELSSAVEHLARERVIHPSQVVEQVDGKIRVVMVTGGLPELAAWIAGSGGEIRVVEPEALRELVRGLHERGLGVGG